MTRAPTSPFDKELYIAVLENVRLDGLNAGICHQIVSDATKTEPTGTSISAKTTSNLWIAFDKSQERDAALLINWADHFAPQSGSHIFSREGRRHSRTQDPHTSQLLDRIDSLTTQVSQLTHAVESLTQQVTQMSSTPTPTQFPNYNYGPQTHNYYCSHHTHSLSPPPGLEQQVAHSGTPAPATVTSAPHLESETTTLHLESETTTPPPAQAAPELLINPPAPTTVARALHSEFESTTPPTAPTVPKLTVFSPPSTPDQKDAQATQAKDIASTTLHSTAHTPLSPASTTSRSPFSATERALSEKRWEQIMQALAPKSLQPTEQSVASHSRETPHHDDTREHSDEG